MDEGHPVLLASCWTVAGSAGPIYGAGRSEYALTERIAAAAAAGYLGVGLLHSDLEVVRDDPGWPEIARVIEDCGITVVELEMITDWHLDGPRRAASDRARDTLLRAAEVFGPRDVKVGGDMTGAPSSPDRMAAEFATLCAQFADAGCPVAFEPMPFSDVPTLADGVALVDAAGHLGGGLMLDLWHVARAGDSLEDVAALDPRYVVAVELDDAPEAVEGTLLEDTLRRRRLPGHGDQDVTGFVRAVAKAGFTGPWGVEILSDEHRRLSLREQAERSYAAARDALAVAGPPSAGPEG